MYILFQPTGELLMYIAEKAFILEIGLILVIVPALLLTAVSFDWNYETVSYTDGIAPQSYWIQLYIVLYGTEIVDCIAICDATFMLSFFLCGVHFMYNIRKGTKNKDQRSAKCNDIIRGFAKCYQNEACRHVIGVIISLCCCSMSIIFVMILCQFAESGFFSATGNINAGFLWVWTFVVKMFMGVRFFQLAKNDRYVEIKKLFGDKSDDYTKVDEQALVDETEAYQMETIHVEQDTKKVTMNE